MATGRKMSTQMVWNRFYQAGIDPPPPPLANGMHSSDINTDAIRRRCGAEHRDQTQSEQIQALFNDEYSFNVESDTRHVLVQKERSRFEGPHQGMRVTPLRKVYSTNGVQRWINGMWRNQPRQTYVFVCYSECPFREQEMCKRDTQTLCRTLR